MALFIGGPSDGKRQIVKEDLEVVTVDYIAGYNRFFVDSTLPPTEMFKTTRYLKTKFAGESRTFTIYRWCELDVDDMIGMLLQNYRGKNG
jgi:hypothetical protein